MINKKHSSRGTGPGKGSASGLPWPPVYDSDNTPRGRGAGAGSGWGRLTGHNNHAGELVKSVKGGCDSHGKGYA